jgi:hypothetical protein
MVKAIIKSVAADTDSYDLALFWPQSPAQLIVQNALYDWQKIPYVNTKADWYNQSANKAFTINGKQYLAISDISYTIQQYACYLFNKDLCKDLGLDFPYQLVYDGKWTYEAFLGYLKNAYRDLNGDGQKDKDDQYGCNARLAETAQFIRIWDEMPVSITQSGFALNIYSGRIADMVGKLSDLCLNNPDVFLTDAPWVSWYETYKFFLEKRSLFEVYGSEPDKLRTVEFDYGYLPYPKDDENQNAYTVGATGGCMCVPINKTEENIEFAGAVIEALSAASNKHIADAFVSSYFENKILRDEDSVNIFRLMRRNMTYEPAMYFDTSGMVSSMKYYIDIVKSGGNLASQYESEGAKIESAFKDMYESIIKNQ